MNEELRRRLGLRRIGREEMPGWLKALKTLARRKDDFPIIGSLSAEILKRAGRPY